VFITAGPITKLFAGGEEESGGHVCVCLYQSGAPREGHKTDRPRGTE
jgi:hypothetical protein